jgi:hypothetical protein
VQRVEFDQTILDLKIKLGKAPILNWGQTEIQKLLESFSEQPKKLPK